MRLSVIRYAPENRYEWDAFVAASRNGTFLFNRDYMEYHAYRFVDYSLMVFTKERLVALFPANRQEDCVTSHGGLTYGGLILGNWATAQRVSELLSAVCEQLRGDGVRICIYKTVPTIYHRSPAEEDRYALFRCSAHLFRRDVLTVVTPDANLRPNSGRAWSLKRARRVSDVQVGRSEDWAGFWDVLCQRLRERHGTSPVHDLAEIMLLAVRFPSAIRLVAATVSGEIAAGAVLYESGQVVRTQYLAGNAFARRHGLLDLVVQFAIEYARQERKCFDFGSSAGFDGDLDPSLAYYKESFGGRTVVHDFYRIELA
jgi:hypothetical protein